ncbi:MAG TPA: hypothetical protein VL172_01090 [Kofleriaceae bacterium]|jgi:hypothetical protein|nr:hypothetical protein [Kofleriaceae bacterium]
MKKNPERMMHLVAGLDGGPIESDGCPICAMLAAQGETVHAVSDSGELVPMEPPRAQQLIEVQVRGNGSTWPYLPLEALPCPVPVGCTVGDLLEYLPWFNREFRITFPPGTLSAQIAGEPCEPGRVLRPGEDVVVSGRRDPELSRMMADLLHNPWR